MNPSAASSTFEGVSGSIIVSITAFTIVFVVLAGLTAVIYAIKFFAGTPSDSGKSSDSGKGTPPAPSAAVGAALVPAASRPEGDRAKRVAAITAAILAATGGRGRVLSVIPEGAKASASCGNRTWSTAGRIEQVGNRLSRTWKH